MKTLYFILATSCCIIGYSQEKNSTRKDFKIVVNNEAFKAQMRKDSLNVIKSTNTKKVFVLPPQENSSVSIDTIVNSKTVPLNSSKKKL
ncbi:hypothetical protein [Flavobacterium sp. 25HG05S-40]|uniref:hypothetical protein n=1 Tax=Flavobacterium sp. 25HG05S-40 TaxID=3458682 RepID=UPI004043D0C1